MYIFKTYKKILPDIVIGLAIGVIWSVAVILWGTSDTAQRIILAVFSILVLFAAARVTWPEKHSNNGDNGSDNSPGIVSIDSKKDSSNRTTNS